MITTRESFVYHASRTWKMFVRAYLTPTQHLIGIRARGNSDIPRPPICFGLLFHQRVTPIMKFVGIHFVPLGGERYCES